MAISGNSAPRFSTLANFVSRLGPAIGKIFAQVLAICDRQGLIGRPMFAIDGVKLPSNASKAKSGKRKDFVRQLAKMEKAAEQMLAKQRERDLASADAPPAQRAGRQIERLQSEMGKLREWLKTHPHERKSAKGQERLSNRTDTESAKMATGKGVIQGYTGVAAVDEAHQIIVAAQAHGTGSEQELLAPVSQALAPLLKPGSQLVADAGYHSEANLLQLEAHGIEATIPDNGYRSRDARYAEQHAHRAKPDPLGDKRPEEAQPKRFGPQDFQVAQDASHCLCPAGKRLYRNGSNCHIGGRKAVKFTGTKRDCENCPLPAQCLRHPQRTPVRQVAIFLGRHEKAKEKA